MDWDLSKNNHFQLRIYEWKKVWAEKRCSVNTIVLYIHSFWIESFVNIDFFHRKYLIKIKNKKKTRNRCVLHLIGELGYQQKNVYWIRWKKPAAEKISTGKCLVLPLHSANDFHTAAYGQHINIGKTKPFLEQHTIQLISSSRAANISNAIAVWYTRF